LIDEAAIVVDDDLFTGLRYFAKDVAVDRKPIEALADRYLERIPPCPTKVDWETDWTDYIKEMVNRSKAQGVISLLVKFCPPHMLYYPDIRWGLAKAGIPDLLLETEHEVVSLEAVRTRLQAFIETIGGA
jgi:benzoyl-CoA reductase/2-hydroxyglutaryl-CoA dehydratase subunit BcrC/BadD/HgdB